jgi:hypothetical protein
MTSTRAPILIAGGVIALCVIAVAAVLVLGKGGPATFPADSPEGTIQRYLAAWDDRDMAAAHAFFSAQVRESMDLEAFERAREQWAQYTPSERARRALFGSSRVAGSEAFVTVTIEEFSADGLGGSTYRYDQELRLVREDGAWRIDEPLVWLEVAPVEPSFGTGG